MEKVFITGISKGIGRSVAEYLNEKGYSVAGTCRNPANQKDKIPGVEYYSLDVTNQASIDSLEPVLAQVDILINNAGQSQLGAVEEMPLQKYKDLIDINVVGLIGVTQKVLPGMRKRRRGTIINIGSMVGSFPLPYSTSYCMTKAAVQSFTISMRQELKQFGIKVVLVEPNDIKTTIEPDFALGEDSEYKPQAQKVREQIRSNMSKAQSPVIVAKKILKIIKARNPSPKYAVGGNGELLLFAKRLLPDKLAEKLTMKTYNL